MQYVTALKTRNQRSAALQPLRIQSSAKSQRRRRQFSLQPNKGYTQSCNPKDLAVRRVYRGRKMSRRLTPPCSVMDYHKIPLRTHSRLQTRLIHDKRHDIDMSPIVTQRGHTNHASTALHFNSFNCRLKDVDTRSARRKDDAPREVAQLKIIVIRSGSEQWTKERANICAYIAYWL